MVARRTSAGRMLFFQVKRTWVTRVTGFWDKLDEIFQKLWKRSKPFLLTSAQAVRDGVRNTDFQITLGIPKLAGEKSCCHGGYLAVWLRVFKKDSREESITYGEALDQALCYGWIDGQKKAYDEHSWLQKFTPRRPKSGWSKMNTRHAERLIESEKMAPSGLKEVGAAKRDGALL